jgi:hypothetical protein
VIGREGQSNEHKNNWPENQIKYEREAYLIMQHRKNYEIEA